MRALHERIHESVDNMLKHRPDQPLEQPARYFVLEAEFNLACMLRKRREEDIRKMEKEMSGRQKQYEDARMKLKEREQL